MPDAVSSANSNPGFVKIWARRLLTVLAVVPTVAAFLIVVGVLFDRIPWLGVIGTLFESLFSLHIVITGIIGCVLALAARRLGGKRVATVTAVLAGAAILGSLIPLVALVRTANLYGASISWTDHLRAVASGTRPARSQTLSYATIDGKNLYADIFLPAHPVAGKSAPVLMMHGGGYVGGDRSMDQEWDRWLPDHGYTVFDVDYRLAPPPTWNQAAQDAACAMAWVEAHADTYHVAPDRMLIAGLSAGAGLALQVAYGLGDGTVQSSCGGTVPLPKAVFAMYPPEDFKLGWDLNTGIGDITARRFNSAYLGGSPEQYPERYRAVSATFHVRPGLPPTLIASGENDHLVPFQGHVEMLAKLKKAGVPNVLVAVPYSDHAFDALPGSLGSQITRHALAEFLTHYLPATESH
jgi:acetyl esterase/lipase